jgi:hypothetical protein
MAQNRTQLAIRKIADTFRELNPTNDPYKAVWLMSIDNEEEEMVAGRMVSAYVGHTQRTVSPVQPHIFTGARLIAEKTHRLATDEEIETYLAAEKVLAKKLYEEEARRKTPLNITVMAPEAVAVEETKKTGKK